MSRVVEYTGNQQAGIWSPAIWGNCDIEDIKARGEALIWEDDFATFGVDGSAYQIVEDTAGSARLTKVDVGRGGGLEFEHDGATDNDEVNIELGSGSVSVISGFVLEAGTKTWFEAMFQTTNVTDHAFGMAIVLGESGIGAANMLTDDSAALADKSYVGVSVLNADSDLLDFVYNTASGGGEVSVGTKAIAISTSYSIGIYSDGTTCWFYFNGEKVDEDGVLLTATDFPNGLDLVPAASTKMGTISGTGSMTLQGWRVVCDK
ncbi:MAG: hypothetical protein CL462_10315 [Acidimicrobiaceae bacterium]|nr:hypothetical protein [Acidimicrobiaceae bacterium]